MIPIPLSGQFSTAIFGAGAADSKAIGLVIAHILPGRETSLEVKGKATGTTLAALGIDQLEETQRRWDMDGSLTNEMHNIGEERPLGGGVLENVVE